MLPEATLNHRMLELPAEEQVSPRKHTNAHERAQTRTHASAPDNLQVNG